MNVTVSPQTFEHCIDALELYATSLENRLANIESTLQQLSPNGEAIIAYRHQAAFALHEIQQIKRIVYLADEKHKQLADFTSW